MRLSREKSRLGIICKNIEKSRKCIGLPDIDGIEATRRLGEIEDTRDIPVVALTASAMADDRERASKANFARYITKPIRLESFFKVIETLLEMRKPE